MKIDEFLDQFHIKEEQIASQFKLLEINVPIDSGSKCPYCKDPINHTMYKSDSWSGVMYCHLCKTISYIAYQDLMGGGGVYAYANVYGSDESNKNAYIELTQKPKEPYESPFKRKSVMVTGQALEDVNWIDNSFYLNPKKRNIHKSFVPATGIYSEIIAIDEALRQEHTFTLLNPEE